MPCRGRGGRASVCRAVPEHARVDVPILSDRKYAKAGFSFHFSEVCGYMQSRHSRNIFDFIESDGAFLDQNEKQAAPQC